jgi:hypothetical protein
VSVADAALYSQELEYNDVYMLIANIRKSQSVVHLLSPF